jgi:hypothetical protein
MPISAHAIANAINKPLLADSATTNLAMFLPCACQNLKTFLTTAVIDKLFQP